MSRVKRAPLAERLRKSLEEGTRFAREDLELQTKVVPVGKNYSGRQVVMIRKKRGLSQAEFARLLAVNVKTVQSWEQGVRKPSKPTMRLLQVFDEPEAFRGLFEAMTSDVVRRSA
jgi:putative transcriptional regulator